MGFDWRSEISLPDGNMDRNVIIFKVGMSPSVHIYNKKDDISILGKGPKQELHDTTLRAEAQYSKHYNGSKSFLFVSATKLYQFKAHDSEIKRYPLCLRNISGDFSANNMKKTGLNRCVYSF